MTTPTAREVRRVVLPRTRWSPPSVQLLVSGQLTQLDGCSCTGAAAGSNNAEHIARYGTAAQRPVDLGQELEAAGTRHTTSMSRRTRSAVSWLITSSTLRFRPSWAPIAGVAGTHRLAVQEHDARGWAGTNGGLGGRDRAPRRPDPEAFHAPVPDHPRGLRRPSSRCSGSGSTTGPRTRPRHALGATAVVLASAVTVGSLSATFRPADAEDTPTPPRRSPATAWSPHRWPATSSPPTFGDVPGVTQVDPVGIADDGTIVGNYVHEADPKAFRAPTGSKPFEELYAAGAERIYMAQSRP